MTAQLEEGTRVFSAAETPEGRPQRPVFAEKVGGRERLLRASAKKEIVPRAAPDQISHLLNEATKHTSVQIRKDLAVLLTE